MNKMLRKMSFKQFKEWMIYSQLEPFDEARADFRAAQIVTALLNLHRKKGAAPFKVEDIRMRFGDDDIPRQTPQQQQAIGKMFADLFNSFEDEKAEKRKRANDRRQSGNPVRQATSRR